MCAKVLFVLAYEFRRDKAEDIAFLFLNNVLSMEMVNPD